MSFFRFVEWLEGTEGSVALHESLYMFPLVESIHVWGLALFVGFAMVLDLRLMSVILRRVPVSEVAGRILPWTVAGFVVMLLSGLVTFYARPVHYYQSIFLRAKVVLLLLAGVNAWVFHATIWRNVSQWDRDPITPKRARVAGAASLVLWVCIIFLGRAIAYNWFDCDSHPRPLLAWLQGCAESL